MPIKERIRSNIANIPGWSTRRKIVVFESDDWGSIRMSSQKDMDDLTKFGFDFSKQPFNLYDALESNDDLTALYDVLRKHKGLSGRHPVFTAVSIMANPDFERIRKSNFQKYFYETFDQTLQKYPNHNKVVDLYGQGRNEELFYPVLHGREHLNVQRWMRALQSGAKPVRKTFEHGVTAAHIGPDNKLMGDFQAAFDLDTVSDLDFQERALAEGIKLFENWWNYTPEYFVPPNGPFNNSLLKTLSEGGVKYVLGGRIQNEPMGDGKYKKHLHYLGQKTRYNQRYLTRNVMFEPSLHRDKTSIVNSCLKSMERAFRWGKPAVICTHRINYIGYINEKNRHDNLIHLNKLLSAMIKRWPDLEFMTSVELGNLIANGKS